MRIASLNVTDIQISGINLMDAFKRSHDTPVVSVLFHAAVRFLYEREYAQHGSSRGCTHRLQQTPTSEDVHCAPLLSANSLSMNAAYQSGQFSSFWLICASCRP